MQCTILATTKLLDQHFLDFEDYWISRAVVDSQHYGTFMKSKSESPLEIEIRAASVLLLSWPSRGALTGVEIVVPNSVLVTIFE